MSSSRPPGLSIARSELKLRGHPVRFRSKGPGTRRFAISPRPRIRTFRSPISPPFRPKGLPGKSALRRRRTGRPAGRRNVVRWPEGMRVTPMEPADMRGDLHMKQNLQGRSPSYLVSAVVAQRCCQKVNAEHPQPSATSSIRHPSVTLHSLRPNLTWINHCLVSKHYVHLPAAKLRRSGVSEHLFTDLASPEAFCPGPS